MINDDIRHIIEPELKEGEELLWAEKTHNVEQKSKYLLTPRRARLAGFIFILSSIAFIVLFSVPAGIDNWGTPPQRLLYSVLGFVAIYTFAITAGMFFLNVIVKSRVYRCGAYALTNKRLFELDDRLNIIRYIDASRVEHVSGFEGVSLKPIEAKGNKAYQLGLLANNVLTINYLHGKITSARGTS